MTQASEKTVSVRADFERLLDAFFDRYPDDALAHWEAVTYIAPCSRCQLVTASP
jgi:hypothetical protein